jgi:hypothetical protein
MALTKVDGQLIAAPAAVSGALYTGSLATTPLGGATNPTIGAIETANNYIQAYAYNTANGTFSSADMVVYPNNGTDAAGWVDVGITSNNYSQAAYSITGRNEGYLFMSAPPGSGTSGNLVIGTDSTGQYNSIQMYTNGFGQGKTTPKWQLDGATGNMQVAGSVSAPNTFGFKNRVINGDMRIDQRFAGSNTSASATSSSTYVVDRFNYWVTQANKMTVGQNLGGVTPPTGFTTYLGVASTSAYTLLASDLFLHQHKVEGYNIADLNWGASSASPVTLSFRVYSSLTGTFGGSISNTSGNRFYVFSYTISATNTWTTISITIPGDTTGTWNTGNGSGIVINFGLGVGSSVSGAPGSWGGTTYWSATGATSIVSTNAATFHLTGVQLEKGSQATPFDFRSITQELTLCQRYFEKSWPITTSPGTATWVGAVRIHVMGGTGTSTDGDDSYGVSFKVTKRATPTMATYSPTAVSQVRYYRTGGVNTDGAAYVGAAWDSGFYITTSYAGSGSAANVRALFLDFVADAEL